MTKIEHDVVLEEEAKSRSDYLYSRLNHHGYTDLDFSQNKKY